MGTQCKGGIRWVAVGAVLLPGVLLVPGALGVAQQGGQPAGLSSGRPATAPSARRAPGRGPVAPSRPVNSVGHAGFRANAQDASAGVGVPRPSWELPRTVTPQWEIPSYNPVLPNQVLGNPIDRNTGFAAGGFVGYGAFPNYSFIEPSPSDVQAAEEGVDPQLQGPGPAGYPPDARQQTGYGVAPGQPEYRQPDGGGFAPRRPPYQPEPTATGEATHSAAAGSGDGLEHPAITLIFRDGRPPQQIRSYVLTGTTLLALENGHQSRIPLTDLDLPATEKRNRDAGVDFAVPGSGR